MKLLGEIFLLFTVGSVNTLSQVTDLNDLIIKYQSSLSSQFKVTKLLLDISFLLAFCITITSFFYKDQENNSGNYSILSNKYILLI